MSFDSFLQSQIIDDKILAATSNPIVSQADGDDVVEDEPNLVYEDYIFFSDST